MARASNSKDTTRDPNEADAAVTAAYSGETDDGVKWFDGTITKIDKDGNTVLSDHLAPGEQLRRETTDRFQASLLTREGQDRDGDGQVDREHRQYRRSDSDERTPSAAEKNEGK